MQEKTIEMKTCKHCKSSFDITDKDLEFYEKVSPIFGGKKYLIPSPTLCPSCRQQRRLVFRNERKLYHRKCDLTGNQIISNYSPDKPYKIYNSNDYWSDKWNPLDYGKDFDFSRGFFEQFDELVKEVPQIGLLVGFNTNSDYVNYSANTKNSYLIFASSQNEDSMYSRWIMHCKGVIDSNNCSNCENCYECIDGVNLNNSKYCIGCIDSYNCIGCYDLVGCHDCIGCSLLRNKSYCINNKQLSKEEYLSIKSKIKISSEILTQTLKNGIHRSKFVINSENCEGDYIINSKNISHGFDIENCENCKYVTNALNLKNTQDIDFQAFDDSFAYEALGFENTTGLLFSYGVLQSHKIILSYCCFNGNNNLFGCVGLRDKSYCVLNKQYSKEEYETLVPKIIEHMMETGEWGEFFPASISPFGYNETLAGEYYPLEKENAIKLGFKWSDYEKQNGYNGEFYSPIKISNYNEKIVGKEIAESNKLKALTGIIKCVKTQKPFRLVKAELEFYIKNNIEIPKIHPDQRHLDRLKLRNPRKLFDRICDKCGKEIKTTYAPDRKEIVYCESCYLEII